MPKKKIDTPLFEIVVVLAIVAIVAITGQVLTQYEKTDNAVTGFAVADYEEEVEDEFLDVGVDNIYVNPPSPLIGEPFEIRISVANKGFVDINTPFYVEAKLVPSGKDISPIFLYYAITQVLKPKEKATAVFNVLPITNEGPMRIIATADSTGKLDDDNPSNNQRSKTIIINTK